MEPSARNSGQEIPDNQSSPAATRLEESPRNGMMIEEPDSWRKIRKTAAILYREDLRLALVREINGAAAPTR